MRTLFTVLLMVGIAVGQNGTVKMNVKDFTPEIAEKLHAKVCAHGPTHFCGPLLNKHGQFQDQDARIPKDAKPGKYCMWIEYDGGETELRKCFEIDASPAPEPAPKKPAKQKPDTNAVILRSESASPAWLDCKSNRFRVNPDNQTLICDEPVDVPAIQVATRLGCDTTGETHAHGCMDHSIPVYSCADKSRILEHDESTPAKYWCRKPQP